MKMKNRPAQEVERFEQWQQEYRLAEHGRWPTGTWFQKRRVELRLRELALEQKGEK